MSWVTFWTAFLVVSIVGYCVLVVVVSVRGFDDLRRMFDDKDERSQ